MASGEDETISVLDKLGKDYLNCAICHDRYNQPKMLNCLHSYCEECLLKYQASQGPVKLKCPVCRRETVILEGGVAGLQTNFPLRGMVEAFQKQEKLLASGRSSPSTAERIETPPPQRTVCDCRKHPGERTWFYCEPCQDLVCRVCTTKTHRDHDYHEIDAAAVTCRESLRGYFPQIEDLLSGIEDALEASRTNTQLIASAAKSIRETVEERAQAALSSLMDAKQRILHEINATEMARAKATKEQTKILSVLLSRMQHSLGVSEELTTSATDEDLLSLYPIIHSDLKSLSSHPVTLPQDRPSPMKLLPPRGKIHMDLGKLFIDTNKWKMAMKVGKLGLGTNDFDGARGLCLCSDGDIAVADMGLWTKGITIFSSDWSFKTSMKFTNNPRDVASVNDCIVVADNTNQVKVYDANRQLALKILTTPPSSGAHIPVNIVSVAATHDTILIGDVQRKVITEHRCNDGVLLRTIPTTVPPYFVAVNAAGRLLLSGMDTGKIVEIDDRGMATLVVTPMIEGEDRVSCRGICYGEDDSFYVVLHGKESPIGHVHQYSSTGLYLGCVVKDLYDPNGITLTSRGELAVADCFSIKVYQKL